jgi:glutaredoxin
MRRARLFGTGGWLLLALLTSGLLACDGFDPSALLPPKWTGAEADGRADARAERTRDAAARVEAPGQAARDAGNRDPDMESIGPDASMRIYYQFVDNRGRVQFVERLSDVPADWRDRVGFVEMNRAPPLTPLEARRTWRVSADRSAEILLASARSTGFSASGGRQDVDVVLYSATWCGWCTKARAHLDREGIQYEIRDVDIDAVSRELREKTGRGGVPVLDFSGEILRGYSPGQYDRAIETIRS